MAPLDVYPPKPKVREGCQKVGRITLMLDSGQVRMTKEGFFDTLKMTERFKS